MFAISNQTYRIEKLTPRQTWKVIISENMLWYRTLLSLSLHFSVEAGPVVGK